MDYAENLFYGANAEIHRRAKALRAKQTFAEKLLWSQLRGKQLGGYKFRRQHPIKSFIVDFYCHELRLAIELDGEIHEVHENSEYDNGRTFEIEELGVMVLRFKNQEVSEDMEAVLKEILDFAKDKK